MFDSNNKEKFLPFSAYLPETFHNLAKKFIENGYYSSKNDFLKDCINIAIPKILENMAIVQYYINSNSLNNLNDFLKEKGYKILKSQKGKPKKEPLGNPFFEKIVDNGVVKYIPIKVQKVIP